MSNDELLHHIMLYSKHGSLMQLIVMEGIRNYAEAIVDAEPGFLGTAALMFNEDDWRNCCRELLDTLANRGQLMTEEISVEVELEDFTPAAHEDPEKAGLLKTLLHLVGQGWQPVELYDSEEWRNFKAGAPLPDVVEACAEVEMATLRLRHWDGRTGSLGLVWGNSPLELIADHTTDHGFDEAVAAAQRSVWPNYPEE